MKVFEVEYDRLTSWSHTDLAYLKHDPALAPFVAYPPTLQGFSEAVEVRKQFPVDRALWVKVLKKQYAKLGYNLPIEEQVLLSENTYSIHTAHQPTLLTGPLFHVYKIASTIHLARQLTHVHPEQPIVPVFIVGGEDHDWAEINHVYLFGKKMEWERTAGGPGGRLSTEGLDRVLEQVKEVLKNTPHGNELLVLLETALQKSTTYGEFHQALLIALFGHHGLVVFNMDDVELKRAFIPVMEKELRSQFSLQTVARTQAALEQAGFKPQSYCRPINLFYLSPGSRERIDSTDGGFVLAEQKKEFSLEEIVAELHAHPERFSPNVILRPLYQEFILPGIAYVGGGGELAYWLERKAQFKEAGVHFPVLLRRNSLLTIDGATASQMEKADLLWEDLLDEYHVIVKNFLIRQHGDHLTYEQEEKSLQDVYAALVKKAEKVDPTLAKSILAEESKQLKWLEQLGARILRAEKQQQETHLKRIQKLKEKLFPDGKLQERHDNFLPFYASLGPSFITALIEVCDPLEERFKILMW